MPHGVLDNATRLQAQPLTTSGAARARVDRTGHGRLLGVSVVTEGPALGHGIRLTSALVEQVAARLNGVPGRWTHGGLSDDGLGRHLGRWENARLERGFVCDTCGRWAALALDGGTRLTPRPCLSCEGGAEERTASRVVADFAFSGSGHRIQPDGLTVSAPDYLMQRAEEDPRTLGVSIVARLKVRDEDDDAGDMLPDDDDGKREDEEAELDLSVARPLLRADFVADPAANPTGLASLHAGTGAPSELTEEAARQVRGLVSRLGPVEARARALAFLSRILPEQGTAPPTPSPQEGRRMLSDNEETALRAEATKARAEAAALSARVTALEGEIATRRKADGERYVASLRSESARVGAPIPEPRLALVASRLNSGDDEGARAIGDTLLESARERGAGAFVRTAPGASLAPAPGAQSKGEELAAASAEVINLERARIAARAANGVRS